MLTNKLIHMKKDIRTGALCESIDYAKKDWEPLICGAHQRNKIWKINLLLVFLHKYANSRYFTRLN